MVYISGAFLSADMDDKVHVVFRSTLAEMAAAYPALYQTFVLYATGQAVLYIRLLNALYSCLKSALLF